MNHDEAIVRVKELTAALEKANYEYYVLDNPSLSDAEFDRLMNELSLIEGQFPDLRSKNSPTQRVGGQVIDEFKKIPHKRLMLSLGNVYNEDEMRDFDRRVRELLHKDTITYMGRAFEEAKLYQIAAAFESISGLSNLSIRNKKEGNL